MFRFAVIGAGAIGSVIGWRLARAGADVLLLGRGPHLEAMRSEGLRCSDGVIDSRLPVQVCSDASGQSPRDVVFITTKAQDIAAALESAAPLIGPETVLIPAVNGLPWWYFKGLEHRHGGPIESVDPGGHLWQRFGAERIVGAVVHLGASLPEPGWVRQAGDNRLTLGELSGESSERAQAIAALLGQAGLPTVVHGSIRDEVWSKLIGNISTNPLSVVFEATLDRLFNEPELLGLVHAVMLEAMTVGACYGVRFALDPSTRIDVGRRLGAFRTSMLQDFDRGRPLETAAIVGAVLELADRADVPMPVTRHILQQVQLAQLGMQSRISPKRPALHAVQGGLSKHKEKP